MRHPLMPLGYTPYQVEKVTHRLLELAMYAAVLIVILVFGLWSYSIRVRDHQLTTHERRSHSPRPEVTPLTNGKLTG